MRPRSRRANVVNPETSGLETDAYSTNGFFSLKGKVSVVSGASGGLGGSIALALSGCGSTVALAGRNAERLTKVKREVEKIGGLASVHIMDVLKEKNVEKVAKEIYQKHGKIDVLVNAHGINYRLPTVEYPMQSWRKVIDTNLKGTFITCKTFGKYMTAQRAGKIVNLSSTAAGSGYKWGYSAYSSSKGGVDSLTRTLSVEWGSYGITVNSIAPYFIETELTKKFLGSPIIHEEVVRNIPSGRLGYPKDVAGAVVFFASSASDWISGQVLYVDGGYMAR